MFIVWGKKRVERKAGHVADFCQVCRCARTFRLTRVGMAGHLYYISVSEGELLGFHRTCDTCGTVYGADPAHYVTTSSRRDTLEALTAATQPRLNEAWADRLALEAQIRTSAALLPADQRAGLIREPFVLLSPQVESQYGSTHVDKEVGLAVVGAIALLMLLPPAVRLVLPDDAEPAVLTALAVGVMLVLWQMFMVNGRFLRRQVIPALARALRPLRPTHAELDAALAELKQHGHKIGTKVKVADLAAQIGEANAASVMRVPGQV